jgi:putative effector of murein hydrolase
MIGDRVLLASIGDTIFACGATVAGYAIGRALQRAAGGTPLVNPVLVAMVLLGGALHVADIDPARYAAGARPIQLLLGTATVAFAVPLVRQATTIARHHRALLVAIVAGGTASALTAVILVRALGASDVVVRTMIPKSITAPIAMGIAERVGGVPALAALFTITTGIIGASVGAALLDRLAVRAPLVRGVALGTAAHGIGAAAAFAEHPVAGAFAGLALALHGVLGAVVIPVVVRLLAG